MTPSLPDHDARLTLVARRLGGRGRRDAPLGPLTTYRVGGHADLFVEARSLEDLRAAAMAVAGSDLPVLVIGRGSNLLVADAGFRGLAVALVGGFDQVAIVDETVTAGGAASLPVVARQTAAVGLRGFEWAVGVPGSIGGAVRMNAGGHGSDMAASLQRVHLVDLSTGDDGWVAAGALDLDYRRSAVTASQVVTAADLALARGDRVAAEEEISEIVRWRRANQPGGPNAGSVFANPEGDSAGRLIEAAGLKGLRVGTAQVSMKHANFIQADEGGSADDIWRLMGRLQAAVREAAGTTLRPETRLIGFGAAPGLPAGPDPVVEVE